MRTYIDPKTYLYTEDEWQNYEFTDRFQAVVDILIGRIELGEKSELGEIAVNFRCPGLFQEAIWSMNPFIDAPEPRNQYRVQFMNRILPELIRTISYCPDDMCNGAQSGALPTPLATNKETLPCSYASELGLCTVCGDARPAIYAYVDPHRCLELNSGFFEREVELTGCSIYSLVDIVDLFPGEADGNKDSLLSVCLEATLSQMIRENIIPAGTSLTTVKTSTHFFSDVESADMKGNRHAYIDRIARCIVQIASGVDINASIHSMKPETFTIDKISIAKWNAHVYKMGISAQDLRCSRIYFGYTSNGIILWSYNPDAH